LSISILDHSLITLALIRQEKSMGRRGGPTAYISGSC